MNSSSSWFSNSSNRMSRCCMRGNTKRRGGCGFVFPVQAAQVQQTIKHAVGLVTAHGCVIFTHASAPLQRHRHPTAPSTISSLAEGRACRVFVRVGFAGVVMAADPSSRISAGVLQAMQAVKRRLCARTQLKSNGVMRV
jgi:hypothetical protein